MASTSKYSIPNEHNYSRSSKQKNIKQDKNKDGPNNINLPEAKVKKMVKNNVKIPIVKSVAEQNDSLFGRLKTNKDLITLPENWFCEVSKNSIQLPISVTFFTLNNSCFTKKRYLEKQLVINLDSEITFVVNGKNLIPSEFGLKTYTKPIDIESLQSFIQEFDSINICQGMTKQNVTLVKLRVIESNERWWHPNCSNTPAKKSFLCYSCKILNSIILQVIGQQRNHQQKPLPIDSSIPSIKKSNIIEPNQIQIKREIPAKVRKIIKTTHTSIHEHGSESEDSI
ncbi:Hypothetical protein CINCED_3A018139 [Cinara cedri]|uniref:Uncharacterized protein n=1 Tax=Cinara cedri TaxID=506608 RepID=A0A5E4MH28_9HEMI|nr:Hypothetical protein CINCED_3A018139 [Cinara cedri]